MSESSALYKSNNGSGWSPETANSFYERTTPRCEQTNLDLRYLAALIRYLQEDPEGYASDGIIDSLLTDNPLAVIDEGKGYSYFGVFWYANRYEIA